MNNYEDLYQGYDDEKLKAVISEAYKYTEEALVAAKIEIEKRGINIHEITIKQPIHKDNNELFKKLRSTVREYIPSFEHAELFDAFEIIDHDQMVLQARGKSDRLHKKLIGAFIIVSIYNVLMNYSLIWFMLTDPIAEWDIASLFVIISTISLPIFTFLFYLRKKIGWITILFQFILAFFMNCYSVIYFIVFIVNSSSDTVFYTTEYQYAALVFVLLITIIVAYIIKMFTKIEIRSQIFRVSDDQYFRYLFASCVVGLLFIYALHTYAYY